MKWFNCIKQCFVVVFVLLLFANVLCIGCFDCNGVFDEKSFAKIEPVSVSIGVGMQPVQSGGIYFCNVEQVSGEKAKGGSNESYDALRYAERLGKQIINLAK